VRVTKQQSANNRRRLLGAASRLLREQGIAAAGVDAITEAAGLTHGAFYSQFGSKQAVVTEAVRLAVDQSHAAFARAMHGTQSGEALRRLVTAYLAPRHRDAPGRGCVVAALGADIARQPKRVRDSFTRKLDESLRLLAGVVPGATASRRYDEAIALFSALVGALILARAVSDASLSRRILDTATRRLTRSQKKGRR